MNNVSIIYLSLVVIVVVTAASGGSRDCWEHSGTQLITQSRLKDHVILAAMGYYDETICKTGVSHLLQIKLDGYQEWIAAQMYIRKP